jgi:hypothetical protein
MLILIDLILGYVYAADLENFIYDLRQNNKRANTHAHF